MLSERYTKIAPTSEGVYFNRQYFVGLALHLNCSVDAARKILRKVVLADLADKKEAALSSNLTAEEQYEEGNKYYRKGLFSDAKHFTDAVCYYHLAAEKGHREAQYDLGYCYDKGLGVLKDAKEAKRFYHLAALQGHCIAQGSLIQKSRENNFKKLRRLERLAQKTRERQYELGNNYFNKGNLDDAIFLYRCAAAKGCAPAQNKLGRCYEEGAGVQKNSKEAVRLYRLAAENGYARAQHNLAGVTKTVMGLK